MPWGRSCCWSGGCFRPRSLAAPWRHRRWFRHFRRRDRSSFMQMPKRHTLILTAVAAIVLLAIAYSFRAPAVLVDSAVAEKGLLQQVVEEEGRTRLPNRYQVSAHVTGYLSRYEQALGAS